MKSSITQLSKWVENQSENNHKWHGHEKNSMNDPINEYARWHQMAHTLLIPSSQKPITFKNSFTFPRSRCVGQQKMLCNGHICWPLFSSTKRYIYQKVAMWCCPHSCKMLTQLTLFLAIHFPGEKKIYWQKCQLKNSDDLFK